MQSMRRLSLHNHTKISQRRNRYKTLPPPPLSSILDNQLFNSKAGVAYVVSLIGCIAYNYIHFASKTV